MSFILGLIFFIVKLAIVGVLVILIASLALGGYSIHKLKQFFDKKFKQPQADEKIVDVTPEPVPHAHNSKEKIRLIAVAFETVSANGHKASDIDDVFLLMNAQIRNMPRHQGVIFIKSRQNLVRLDVQLGEYGNCFKYTQGAIRDFAGSVTSLISYMNEHTSGLADDTAYGILYVTEYIQSYMNSLFKMNTVLSSIHNSELRDVASEFCAKCEKLYWSFLSYPDAREEYIEFVNETINSMLDKLQILNNTIRNGAASEDSGELLEQTIATFYEINKALSNIQKKIFSSDLMQASVELEVIRKKLKLDGLA